MGDVMKKTGNDAEDSGEDVNRNRQLPLYLQVKRTILSKIVRGEQPPGSALKSEKALCDEYKVSRVTVRKALKELVDEGLIERKGGSGTYVRADAESSLTGARVLGLLVTQNHVEFVGSIVSGFIGSARDRGWLTVLVSSNDDPDQELQCLDALVNAGIGRITVLPCENSRLIEKDALFQTGRRQLCLIDREPDTKVDYDFVGSDNVGGAYTAVRHLHSQGFTRVAFLSHKSDISSIRQRLDGFLLAARDFGVQVIGNPEAGSHYNHRQRLFIEDLRDRIGELSRNLPMGIVAVNDKTALDCIDILRGKGIAIGKDIAVVGFDNEPAGAFSNPPLTSVAQNGQLIGDAAAKIAVEGLEKQREHRCRIILPTQIILRKSCGE